MEGSIKIIERRSSKKIDRRSDNGFAGHLELLAEMSSHLAISNTSNTANTIERALTLIVQYVNAQAGSLFMLEDNNSNLVCKASVGPIDITGITIKADQGIVGRCVSTGESKMVRDVNNDPDFITEVDNESGFKTNSILCVPLATHNEKIGAIELVNRQDKNTLFTESDLLMLQTLASATSMAITNTRMAADLIDQQRIQQELKMAAEIQRSLLPTTDESLPIIGINIPARKVSGDFYDHFMLDDGRHYFTLGDVSGKGINAALLMAKTVSLFHCMGKTIHQPGKLLSIINGEICETASRGMFVTMVCGIYDPKTGEVVLANSGHEPVLFLNKKMEFSSLGADAPPVGIIPPTSPEETIPEQTLMLEGGCLYLFTDGITEGKLNQLPFGVDRLKQELINNQSASSYDQLKYICALLQQDGGELHDDITIMSIQDER